MDENYTEKKKSNVLKYALTFVAGTAIGVGGLFSYNTFLVKDTAVTDNTKGTAVEKSDSSDITSDDKSITKESKYFTSLKDSKYIYNPSFGSINSISIGLSGEDTKNCTISFNKDYINNGAYGSWGGKINTSKWSVSANVTFDVPVKEVTVGGRGQAASEQDCILFLMQDGTVRYINILNALKSAEFTANYDKLPEAVKIDALSDIDRFYSTSVYSTDPNVVGGHGETIALKNDGTFINIMDYVK